jgi:hypothetical protein
VPLDSGALLLDSGADRCARGVWQALQAQLGAKEAQFAAAAAM